MEEQQHSIDEMFRQSLSDYREAPPAAAWGDIARRLDADEEPRRRGFFMRWPWIAMLFLFIGGAAWFTIAMHNMVSNRLAVSRLGGSGNSDAHRQVSHIARQSGTSPKPDRQNSITSASTQLLADPGSDPAAEDKLTDKSVPTNTKKPFTPSATSQSHTIGNIAQSAHSQGNSHGTKSAASIQHRSPVAGAGQGANSRGLAANMTRAAATRQPAVRALSPGVESVSAKDNNPRSLANNKPAPIEAPSGLSKEAVAPLPSKNSKSLSISPATRSLSQTNFSVWSGDPLSIAPNPLTIAADPGPAVPHSNSAKVTASRTNEPAKTNHQQEPPVQNNSGFKPPIYLAKPGRTAKSALLGAALQAVPQSTFTVKSGDRELATRQPSSNTEPDLGLPPAEKKDSLKKELTPVRNASFSFALLGGYEAGMSKPAPDKIAIAARLQYHINKAFAIGIQPAFRFGSIASTLTDPKAYQRITTHDTSFMSFTTSPSIIPYTDTLYNYIIQEAFDSIVVSGTTVKGRFWEVELPVILSYKLSTALRVYGGPSFNFGGRLPSASTPRTETYTTTRRDTLVQSEPIPSSMSVNYFGTNSSLAPYSTYKPTLVQDPANMRMGYLLGLSYEQKRLLFDVSVHQQLSGFSNVTPGLQKAFSSPYIRLSLGFYLLPQKEHTKKAIE